MWAHNQLLIAVQHIWFGTTIAAKFEVTYWNIGIMKVPVMVPLKVASSPQ